MRRRRLAYEEEETCILIPFPYLARMAVMLFIQKRPTTDILHFYLASYHELQWCAGIGLVCERLLPAITFSLFLCFIFFGRAWYTSGYIVYFPPACPCRHCWHWGHAYGGKREGQGVDHV